MTMTILNEDVELKAIFTSKLREIPDFPKAGILFKDIAPVLAYPTALSRATTLLCKALSGTPVDAILAVDARGFVLGSALADRIGAGLVMVRKPGKLPGAAHRFEYECEYCTGHLEIPENCIGAGTRCIVVDDLLATGGTARATADFAKTLGAEILAYCFLVEITVLGGRSRLTDAPTHAVARY